MSARNESGIALRCIGRVWNRNYWNYSRTWRQNALPQFLEPLLYLTAIGVTLGKFINVSVGHGATYADYVAAALIANAAGAAATFELTYQLHIKLVFIRQYESVLTTPIEPTDIALGELGWGITRGFIYGLVFALIAAVLGHVSLVWLALVPVVLVPSTLAFAACAMLATAVLPTLDQFTYYFGLFMTPQFLFSGTFFPVSALPQWVRVIVWFLPLYHAIGLSRDLLLFHDWSTSVANAAWLMGFSLILTPLAIRRFVRRMNVA